MKNNAVKCRIFHYVFLSKNLNKHRDETFSAQCVTTLFLNLAQQYIFYIFLLRRKRFKGIYLFYHFKKDFLANAYDISDFLKGFPEISNE